MFDSMVYISRERSLTRRLVSFPLAITAQAVLALAFILHSIFVHETLPPPMLMLSGTPEVAIPVAFVQRPQPPVKKREGPTPPLQDHSLKAPDSVPSEIRPADSAAAQDPGPSGPELPPGWIPTEMPGLLTGPSSDTPPTRQIKQGWEVVKVPQLLHRVEPAYPPAAVAMRQEGRVVLQVVVDERGRVEDVQVLSSSNPIFERPATDAVRRWEYTRPVGQGGQSVACYLTVVVTFALR